VPNGRADPVDVEGFRVTLNNWLDKPSSNCFTSISEVTLVTKEDQPGTCSTQMVAMWWKSDNIENKPVDGIGDPSDTSTVEITLNTSSETPVTGSIGGAVVEASRRLEMPEKSAGCITRKYTRQKNARAKSY